MPENKIPIQCTVTVTKEEIEYTKNFTKKELLEMFYKKRLRIEKQRCDGIIEKFKEDATS